MLLSHTQFIENRVYDDDEEEEATSKDDIKNNGINGDIKGDRQTNDPEVDFINNVSMALRTSMDFIDGAFHQVEVGVCNFLLYLDKEI